MRSQDCACNLDNDCEVVLSLSDEVINDAHKHDPQLCRFMELFHKHTRKPQFKLLEGESPDMKVLCSLWNQFQVWHELLYRLGKEVEEPWRLVIPRDKCSEILSMLHDNKSAGHPGMSRMKLTVGTIFYCPCIRQDIDNWNKCFRLLTMAKWSPKLSCPQLQQELSGAQFNQLSFDVIGPLPIMDVGNRFILKVIDYYSKWAEADALPNHWVEYVVDCILSHWIAHHGIPLRLHSDKTLEFREMSLNNWNRC